MKRLQKALKSRGFWIALLVGGVMAASTALFIDRQLGVAAALCDGCFVAGILVTGFGGLAFVRNQGQFDIFTFGLSHLFQTRWPGLSSMPEDHQKEKLADYRLRMQGKRKSPLGIVLAGVIYLILTAIFYVMYSCL